MSRLLHIQPVAALAGLTTLWSCASGGDLRAVAARDLNCQSVAVDVSYLSDGKYQAAGCAQIAYYAYLGNELVRVSPLDAPVVPVAGGSVTKVAGGAFELSAVTGDSNPVAAAIRSIGLVPVDAPELDNEFVRGLDGVILAGAGGLKNVQILTPREIDAIVSDEKRRDLLGCRDKLACWGELGGILGVDALLVSSISGTGATFVSSLEVVDVRHAEILLHIGAKATGTREVLRAVFVRATREVLQQLVPHADADGTKTLR